MALKERSCKKHQGFGSSQKERVVCLRNRLTGEEFGVLLVSTNDAFDDLGRFSQYSVNIQFRLDGINSVLDGLTDR